ncbi:MAG TPA: hypothetical protein VIV15_04355 [Anaerolineales bacterium]
MIDAFIRSMLGGWGNALLDFYIKNNLWINALVLMYGVLVVLGRTCYRRSASFLLNWFTDQYGGNNGPKSPGAMLRFLEQADVPWGAAKKAYWFPLITPPSRFVLYPKDEKTLQRIFSRETLTAILRPSRGQQDR